MGPPPTRSIPGQSDQVSSRTSVKSNESDDVNGNVLDMEVFIPTMTRKLPRLLMGPPLGTRSYNQPEAPLQSKSRRMIWSWVY